MASARLTYQQGKQCLLCSGALADQSTEVDVCRQHREPTTVVVVATGRGRWGQCEVLTLTHRRVMPSGQATWAGTGEDGRRIIWEDA